jgi:hypothetical protein
MRKAKRNQSTEQNKVEREMRGKAPVPAGVTEAAAGDVESADFCGNGGDDEDGGERG